MDVCEAGASVSSPLFVEGAPRRSIDTMLTEALDAALQRVARGSVVPDHGTERFSRDLAGFDFRAPRPLEPLLDWTIKQLEHGLVHPTHPRYFGLFNPAPGFASECAERIAAAFNPQLASARTSPVAVAIEAHVIAAIAERAGLQHGTVGHFTTGGSEANFAALTCALSQACADFAALGARAFSGQPTLYVSEDAHLAWYKIAHQSGIGRGAVRLVATDDCGRMDLRALSRALCRDVVRGCVPVMVVATAGTTGAGAIDPLAGCAAIARAARLWLHVDAAWGGAVIASALLKGLLAGIEAADSVTIDAHKWFATTMGCGMFLTRHADIQGAAYHVAAEDARFMPSNQRGLDPYVTTAQWSRRFLGLRLFLSLASVGWEGYARHVEGAVDLAEQLGRDLAARGWTLARDASLAVLCAEPPSGGADATSIAAAVVASGVAWVATARVRGRDVVRICITNGRSTPADLGILARALQHAAETLPATHLQAAGAA